MASPAGRGRVLAWALWDCGSTGLNAVVVDVRVLGLPDRHRRRGSAGGTSPASWLGRALAVAGVVVALLAPAHRRLGGRAAAATPDAGILTAGLVLLTAAMSLIRDDLSYLWAGLVLLALTAACSDLASVPYNAMLRQLSTPETSGRISGFGWGAGYVGSMALLLLVYVGFIAGRRADDRAAEHPDGRRPERARCNADDRGVDGRLRAACPHRAAPGRTISTPPARRESACSAPTASCGRTSRAEWRRDRNVVYYLLASAVFRDGLIGRVHVRRSARRQRVRPIPG